MQDEKSVLNVPYIVYESMATRADRTVKRLIVALVVAISLLFACNAVWIAAWMQYDYSETQTIEAVQDGSGTNLVGGGDITLGANGQDYNG